MMGLIMSALATQDCMFKQLAETVSAGIQTLSFQEAPANVPLPLPSTPIIPVSAQQASTGTKPQGLACAQLRSLSLQDLDAPVL
jgi:hypothetical protein